MRNTISMKITVLAFAVASLYGFAQSAFADSAGQSFKHSVDVQTPAEFDDYVKSVHSRLSGVSGYTKEAIDKDAADIRAILVQANGGELDASTRTRLDDTTAHFNGLLAAINSARASVVCETTHTLASRIAKRHCVTRDEQQRSAEDSQRDIDTLVASMHEHPSVSAGAK